MISKPLHHGDHLLKEIDAPVTGFTIHNESPVNFYRIDWYINDCIQNRIACSKVIKRGHHMYLSQTFKQLLHIIIIRNRGSFRQLNLQQGRIYPIFIQYLQILLHRTVVSRMKDRSVD